MSGSHVAGSKIPLQMPSHITTSAFSVTNTHLQCHIPFILLDLLIHNIRNQIGCIMPGAACSTSLTRKKHYTLLCLKVRPILLLLHAHWCTAYFPPQNPSSVNSSLTSASSSSSIRSSNAICPVLDTSRSCSPLR